MAEKDTDLNPMGTGRGAIDPVGEKEASNRLITSGLLEGFLRPEEDDPDGDPEKAAAAAAAEKEADRESDSDLEQDDLEKDEPAKEEDGKDADAGAEGKDDYKVIAHGGLEYEVPAPLAEAFEKGTLRQEDYTRKTQAVAKERDEIRTEKAGIQQERQNLAKMLTQLEAAIEEIAPSKAPDWNKIRAEDPEGFIDRFAEWTIQNQQREAVRAARVEAEKKVREDEANQLKETLAAEEERLHTAIPELKDPEKGPALNKKLAAYARDHYQFDPRDLAAIRDHRVIVILNKARLYDEARAKAKLPAVDPAREVRDGKPNRPRARILKPGPATRTGTKDVEAQTAAAKAAARLAKTGSDRDAAEYLLTSGLLKQ
jgi:hypothetical protein